MGGFFLRNGLNGAKRLNGWNDWNGIHCEQGIFVSIVINTKAKSKPPNLNSLSPIYPSSFRLYPFVQGLS